MADLGHQVDRLRLVGQATVAIRYALACVGPDLEPPHRGLQSGQHVEEREARVEVLRGRPADQRVGRHAYRPEKSGLRFSANAAIPSFWSSVANRSANTSRSITTPDRKSVRTPQLMATFAARRAWVGPFA